MVTGKKKDNLPFIQFRFDLNWLKNQDFFTLVQKIWIKPCRAKSAVDKIQQKLKLLKQFFKGLGFNLQGEWRKKRKEFQVELEELEACEENGGLSGPQIERNTWLLCENLKYLEQEEMYWYERSHENWLLQGDNKTAYFYKCANGRKWKNQIISLEKDEIQIEGDDKLLKHVSEYYAELFGPPMEYEVQLDPSIWDGISKVSEDENAFLWRPFSEDEIKIAFRQMEKNKAAGPDKIPIEFYQSCWEIIRLDILQLFDDFYNQRVDISRLNYRIITLLPKIKEASKIQQFRPICLLNCLYKLITKTLTIRLETVTDKLIHNLLSCRIGTLCLELCVYTKLCMKLRGENKLESF